MIKCPLLLLLKRSYPLSGFLSLYSGARANGVLAFNRYGHIMLDNRHAYCAYSHAADREGGGSRDNFEFINCVLYSAR